jgi:subtilase family serine protease
MKTATTGAACVALTVAFAAAGATGADAASRSTIPGSQPSWATSKALKSAAPSTDVVHARVYLPWRNQSALDALAQSVSTPGSSSYRHFLSAQQFQKQFAPAQSDVVAVQQWLRGAGFTVVDTPSNNHYVAVEGTVAQAQSAFGTTLGEYSAYGMTLRAPEAAPTVPSNLTGLVSAVVGLDESAQLITANLDNGNGNSPKQNHGAPGVGFRAGQPCASYYGSALVHTDTAIYGTQDTPLAPCGYSPAQVRGLYGLTADNTGGGQTVAFVGANASPTLKQDVGVYSDKHGLPPAEISEIVAPGVYKHPDTPKQVPGDYYGEETLDAEAIHTTAPAAKLLYVASSNANQDFDASINHIVDKHLASIISISYGFGGEGVPQGFINSLDKTFQQAVAEGIGVFVSSGDNGDEASTGKVQPDFYADSPNVTAVGGTSAAIVPKSGTAPLVAEDKTTKDGVANPVYGGGTGPDRVSALTAAANWTRSFEVGWQTGLTAISSPGITPQTSGSPKYDLPGTVGDLPGTFNGGQGGGTSTVFAEPAYQQAAIGKASGRVVPDISALADPNTGFLVGQTQQFPDGTYYDEYRIGGTSVAAPLMAGIAADANEAAGGALGFLNPLIYGAYTAHSGAYYDVDQQDLVAPYNSTPAVIRVNYANNLDATATSPTNPDGRSYSVRTEEADSLTTLPTKAGYDTGSGVGSPTGKAFFDGLIAAK